MLVFRSLPAIALAIGLSTSAYAATLDIQDINGVWSSATPAPAIDGVGTNSIRWGIPGFVERSGYDFEPADSLSVESDTAFSLGTFNHLNFPIRGEVLLSAMLEVSFRVGGLTSPITSTFSFVHDETFNDLPRCRNGGANGTGVNAQGCADLVTATVNPDRTEDFTIDGVTYSLDVLGFQFEGQTLEEFFTEENSENSAELLAFFTAVDGVDQPGAPIDVPPGPPTDNEPLDPTGETPSGPTVDDPSAPTADAPPVNVVPLPAGGLLLVSALVLLGLRRRKT
ncbi:THxN family PEP-CTERM protein [Rhodobacteraceae bacterium]|nr:THxN family PEP-CTERM protein [Paracoccaceae bacterium]